MTPINTAFKGSLQWWAIRCVCLGVTCLSVAIMAQQQAPQLPAPSQPSPNFGQRVEKPQGTQLKLPTGFTADIYADNVNGARTMEWAPNGDLFVAQTSQNVVTVLRDSNKDGLPEERFTYVQGGAPAQRGAGGARGGPQLPTTGETIQPFGLAFHEGYLYIGNTNSIVRYKYRPGDTKAQGNPEKLADLPGGGNHFTRAVLFSADGKKIYVSVGSSDNIDETKRNDNRAAVHEYNPDGTGFRIFASGIRNPVGLTLQPGTNTIWTAVNERDNLGDDLVPDYATSVKDGGFYGWPYCYIGNHVDSRVPQEKPDLVARATVPDILIPAHSAALGLTFYAGTQFPQHYRNGLFVALHGSWNRSKAAGYKVIFVPFQNGKPSGPIEDFLTGFVVNDGSSGPIQWWGRPVGVTVSRDGALLVSDDGGNRIWRVRYMAGR
jgi:glucose/arabinose dehydrogenase